MELGEYLREMGLNSYETRVMIHLAQNDSDTAGGISSKANVPMGRIYQILDGLRTKGLVRVIPGKPKRYSGDDIKISLEKFLLTKIEKSKQMSKELANLRIPTKSRNSSINLPSTRFYRGREAHLEELVSLIDTARNEYIQCAPLFIGSYATDIAKRRAISRGVKARVIIRAVTKENRKNVKSFIKNGGEIRVLGVPDLVSMVVCDVQEALLGAENYLKGEERLGIRTTNKALIQVLKKSFESMWQQVKPLT